ncbi:MAG: HEAT repeat domain-containing protein [Candidatus Wallbacteria bacterium]|nr:HEAT repeat domain-containing protein [Candidatus Wallbacteria bacterium]
MTGFQNLSSADPAVRKAALDDLIKDKLVSETSRLELLKDLFTNDPDPEIRAAARKYFHLFSVETAIPDHPSASEIHAIQAQKIEENLSIVFETRSSSEKFQLLKQLIKARVKISREWLVRALDTEKDIFIIAALISLLGKNGDQLDGPVLFRFLQHQDSRVRANAIEALVALKAESAYPEIVPLLQDSDARVKSNAALVLSGIGLEAVLRILKDMIFSGKIHAIESAIYALGKMKSPLAKLLLRSAREKLAVLDVHRPD